jgi:hypothetical protein
LGLEPREPQVNWPKSMETAEQANTEIGLSGLNLCERFPSLKVLIVRVDFFDSSGTNLLGSMEYKPNLAKATSIFPFVLSDRRPEFEAASRVTVAIESNYKIVSGQWSHSTSKTRTRTGNDEAVDRVGLVRFKLTLDY